MCLDISFGNYKYLPFLRFYMGDKITFCGVGGGRVVISNQIRATGGFVINLAGHQIHVDPGPGALPKAKQFGVRLTKTDIIFVSHNHTEHANDVNAVIEAMTVGGIHKGGVLISVPSVISGKQPWLHKYYKSLLNECFSVKVNDVVKVGNLTFTATPTKHDEPSNVGFKLETDSISIGYTSDTTYFSELYRAFKGVKILIINVLRPGNDKWKTHMCTDDAIRLIDKVKPELAILQHFGAKMIRANPMYEARKVQSKTGVRTIAATDGLTISI